MRSPLCLEVSRSVYMTPVLLSSFVFNLRGFWFKFQLLQLVSGCCSASFVSVHACIKTRGSSHSNYSMNVIACHMRLHCHWLQAVLPDCICSDSTERSPDSYTTVPKPELQDETSLGVREELVSCAMITFAVLTGTWEQSHSSLLLLCRAVCVCRVMSTILHPLLLCNKLLRSWLHAEVCVGWLLVA